MNYKDLTKADDLNSIHEIKKDFRKDPAPQEDEIIFDVDVSGAQKNVFGNFRELSQLP